MRIRNLTPHGVTLHGADGSVREYAPNGPPVRLAVTDEIVGDVAEVPIKVARFGEAANLPEPEVGVLLIVAGMVVDALPERDDLVAPHDLVRDEEGRVIGCRSLRRSSH